MQKIRVAFVPNDFLVGGVQRLHLGVFNGLDPEQYEMHLITLFEFLGKRTLYEEVPSYVQTHRLSFNGFKDTVSWIALFRLLRSVRPDVVIASLFFAHVVTRVLKLFFGYPVIITENNTYVNKSNGAIFLDRLLSRVTYKIIAVSETVRRFTSTQERIPLEKFVVVRSGIDVGSVIKKADVTGRETVRRFLGLSMNDRVAINVARLTKQKNQGALIEAFAEFSYGRPNEKLLILGEGSMYDTYATMIQERNAQGRIRLLGNVMDVISHYAVSDYFVSPSHVEGFGIAHVEALACGIPVLTTKTAGPDEMIEEGRNGLFISDPSPKSIHAGLEAMTKLDLRSMRNACRTTADRYDIRHTVALYERLIQAASDR